MLTNIKCFNNAWFHVAGSRIKREDASAIVNPIVSGVVDIAKGIFGLIAGSQKQPKRESNILY